jgi:RHS repeat-associated protein
METASAAYELGVARQKLEFGYDAQGRRVSKKVSNWSGSSYTLASHTLFLYDGWNMVAELNALSSNAAVRTYAWGLDLSGSMQGAGGVSGLLTATDSAGSHFAAFDGNGNVAAYVSASTGVTSANYDYDPFGNEILSEGAARDAFPYRFSGKYADTETGLIDYGLRYFSPSMSRWLFRDPIGERGGINLYGYVNNNAVNGFDYLGLDVFLYFWDSTQGSSGAGHVGIGAGGAKPTSFF